MKINFPNDTDKCEQAVPCALMLDIAASIGELTRCFFSICLLYIKSIHYYFSFATNLYLLHFDENVQIAEWTWPVASISGRWVGSFALRVMSSYHQKSLRKMSTSTQDKTNTSLPLPQERNSYTSTPYLVLTASMARKKWPQGWLTHPIQLVKVCYRLSYLGQVPSNKWFS